MPIIRSTLYQFALYPGGSKSDGGTTKRSHGTGGGLLHAFCLQCSACAFDSGNSSRGLSQIVEVRGLLSLGPAVVDEIVEQRKPSGHHHAL
jgi:hypothetical protein